MGAAVGSAWRRREGVEREAEAITVTSRRWYDRACRLLATLRCGWRRVLLPVLTMMVEMAEEAHGADLVSAQAARRRDCRQWLLVLRLRADDSQQRGAYAAQAQPSLAGHSVRGLQPLGAALSAAAIARFESGNGSQPQP